jgi:predicted nucleic acid-binding Zn ribbon protein
MEAPSEIFKEKKKKKNFIEQWFLLGFVCCGLWVWLAIRENRLILSE